MSAHAHARRTAGRRLAVTRLEDRLTPAFALDPTFGTAGVTVVDTNGAADQAAGRVALQADGRTLLAARNNQDDAVVYRFSTAGAVDGTFPVDFGGQDSGADVTVQPDGKILLVGQKAFDQGGVLTRDFGVARLNPDGSLDGSFGSGGIVTVNISDLVPQTGLPSNDTALNVEVAGDGSIFVSGTSSNTWAVVKLTSAGALDGSFGGGGKVNGPFENGENPGGLVLLPDGNVAFGTGRTVDSGTFEFGVHVLGPTGAAAAFGTGGFASSQATASGPLESPTVSAGDLARLSDGTLVLVGGFGGVNTSLLSVEASGVVARFGPTGTALGVTSGGLSAAVGVAVQPDGKLVVGGAVLASGSIFSPDSDPAVTRLNPNGTIDNTFGDGSPVTITSIGQNAESVVGVALRPDGRIVTGGNSGVLPPFSTDVDQVDYFAAQFTDPSIQPGGNDPVVAGSFSGGVWLRNTSGAWANVNTVGSDQTYLDAAGNIVGVFGPASGVPGVWRRAADSGAWSQLTSLAPDELAVLADGTVVGDFGAVGVWRAAPGGGFVQIEGSDPADISVAADGTVYASYAAGPVGVWRYAGGTWSNINASAATSLEAANAGTVFGVFGGGVTGTWRWTNGAWSLVTDVPAQALEAAADGTLFGDFGTLGVWRLTPTGEFTQSADLDAEQLRLAPNGDVYGDFGANGVWRFNASANAWTQINGLNPAGLTVGNGNQLLGDFPGIGVWIWTASTGTWTQITPLNPTSPLAAF